jgi:hypothetical protein
LWGKRITPVAGKQVDDNYDFMIIKMKIIHKYRSVINTTFPMRYTEELRNYIKEFGSALEPK